MTIQWPSEQAYVEREYTNDFVDFYDELNRLLEICPLEFPDSFNKVVKTITQQDIEITELEQKIKVVSQILELNVNDFPNSVNLLIVWACAEALAKTPSRSTWERISKLKYYYSPQFENLFYDVLILYTEINPDAKTAYIQISTDIFQAFEEKHDQRNITLEDIWRSPHNVAEFQLFNILAILDLEQFIQVISKSQNPDLVNSALMSAGTYCNFNLWEKFVYNIPIAFSNDGRWHQSSITIPSLLTIARDELLRANNNLPYYDASAAEIEAVKKNIDDISICCY